MKVTLLDARRLSAEEYRASSGAPADPWPGGGLHMAFVVENRPNQPIGPVLGEVRVLLGAEPYNTVTNPTSRSPLAPGVIIDDLDAFFASRYGQLIRQRVTPRPTTVAAALEIFVRGGTIPVGSIAVVELEQGATRLPEVPRRFGPVGARDVAYHWFRFRLPLD